MRLPASDGLLVDAADRCRSRTLEQAPRIALARVADVARRCSISAALVQTAFATGADNSQITTNLPWFFRPRQCHRRGNLLLLAPLRAHPSGLMAQQQMPVGRQLGSAPGPTRYLH